MLHDRYLLVGLTLASALVALNPAVSHATDTDAAALDQLTTSAAAPAAGSPAPAARPQGDTRPVTQDQFKEFLRIYKGTVQRLDRTESKVNKLPASGGAAKPGGEEALDLSTATVETTAGPKGGPHSHMGTQATPDFKVYFDLDLINRPGVENLSFDTYHSFLFFELQATPEIQFSFDVNPSPRYYELDYQVTQRLQLRAGKIWIPFDDMSPHNIFGGRVDVSRLQVPGAPAFLPDLWTDLGVGFKLGVVDTTQFSLDVFGYVVNGFREGGKDLITSGSPYPSFSDLPSGPDNNRDKALGGRVHAMIAHMLGLGLSYYNGRWNSDTNTTGARIESQRLGILGLDGQFRIASTELRAGLATMTVNLPTGQTSNRGGYYVELGQKFGHTDDWKALIRAGQIQLDDRVTDTNPLIPVGDQQIVGGTLLWKPGLIQYSIETSYDLKSSPSKTGYSYSAARIVMAF